MAVTPMCCVLVSSWHTFVQVLRLVACGRHGMATDRNSSVLLCNVDEHSERLQTEQWRVLRGAGT